MRYTRALLPTVKEAPAEATTVSHILLLRAGYVRRVGAGIYSFLPLGVKVLRKFEQIIREELNKAGAEEVLLPALLPAEYFQETERWTLFGDTLLRLKDRKGGDYHLGPTHEEIITDLARRELHSYRDLPKNLYQIQTKFRDEPRPRAGLLRCREFLMKDAYSFDVSEEAAKKSYESMRVAYRNIFDRAGFDYRMVSADSGAMGGSVSAEFQVLTQSGEDIVVACSACDYAANLEVAAVAAKPNQAANAAADASLEVEKVETPNTRTIEAVAKLLKAEPERCLKTMMFRAEKELLMVVVRGDHEVNEIKLARAARVSEVSLAGVEEIQRATGSEPGFLGPVGYSGRILVDRAASEVTSAIAGANEVNYHLKNVQLGRDYQGDIVDIRSAVEGDACSACGAPVKLYRGIEAGHIFILGTHYSGLMGATYLDENQAKQPIVMGCYGIGVSRLVAAAIEQHHDKDGICWPISIAPYQVHVVQLGQEPEVIQAVAELEAALEAAGVEVLVDDREQRPGAKFKDADLIGIPLRVTIGARSLQNNQVEIKLRNNPDPKSAELVARDQAVSRLQALISELGQR